MSIHYLVNEKVFVRVLTHKKAKKAYTLLGLIWRCSDIETLFIRLINVKNIQRSATKQVPGLRDLPIAIAYVRALKIT